MSDLTTLERKVDELISREQIRDVLYRYTRHIDRFDVEGVKSGYHPDADDIHWNSFIGNAHKFAEHILREMNGIEFVTHEVTNPLIELDGDRAFVESRYTSRVRIGFEGAAKGEWVESVAQGRYLDVFERRDGEWKIAHRRLAQDGGRISVITDIASYNPDAVGRRAPDDMVYKKFDIAQHAPPPIEPRSGRFEALRDFGKKRLPATA